jgi:hypothetical protein
MRSIRDPGLARLHELAGANRRRVPDQVTLATGHYTEHGEAGLGVVEGNALCQASHNLGSRILLEA